MEEDPQRASELCFAAQARLMRRIAGITDTDVGAPSRLPGWTVGHVLTHLARNADAHARRIAGALDGHDVPRYPGGREQRVREIEEGAGRSAADTVADLSSSMLHLEDVLNLAAAAGWPNGHLMGDDQYGVAACPAHRLREVEMHHVDLGLGYTPADWPEEYVAWDLPVLLATVPERLGSRDEQRSFLAWLAGRGPLAPDTKLADW